MRHVYRAGGLCRVGRPVHALKRQVGIRRTSCGRSGNSTGTSTGARTELDCYQIVPHQSPDIPAPLSSWSVDVSRPLSAVQDTNCRIAGVLPQNCQNSAACRVCASSVQACVGGAAGRPGGLASSQRLQRPQRLQSACRSWLSCVPASVSCDNSISSLPNSNFRGCKCCIRNGYRRLLPCDFLALPGDCPAGSARHDYCMCLTDRKCSTIAFAQQGTRSDPRAARETDWAMEPTLPEGTKATASHPAPCRLQTQRQSIELNCPQAVPRVS